MQYFLFFCFFVVQLVFITALLCSMDCARDEIGHKETETRSLL